MRCAVCPGFPIEQSPKYAPGTPADKGDDDGIDSDDYGGDNDNDDEDVDENDNYCDGDVVVMMSRPTLQPAPPAALLLSSSSAFFFQTLSQHGAACV